MTVTKDAFFVAHRLGERLPQRDADVFDGVMIINMQIARGVDIQIDQAVTGNLIEHVIQERDPCRQFLLACAVQIDGDANLRLVGMAGDICSAHGNCVRSQWSQWRPCTLSVPQKRSI